MDRRRGTLTAIGPGAARKWSYGALSAVRTIGTSLSTASVTRVPSGAGSGLRAGITNLGKRTRKTRTCTSAVGDLNQTSAILSGSACILSDVIPPVSAVRIAVFPSTLGHSIQERNARLVRAITDGTQMTTQAF